MKESLIQICSIIKAPVTFLSLTLIVSCQLRERKSKINYSRNDEKHIVLSGLDSNYEQKDTLAFLTIKIPARLDTFYQWYNRSDCTPCGRMQYRFADTHFQQFAESDWYSIFKPDSICQLTIKHNPIKEWPDTVHAAPFAIGDTNNIAHGLKHEATWCEKATDLNKYFRIINGRPFIISSFISSCSRITDTTSFFFAAETTLKGRRLEFIGECTLKDTAGFTDNMYKSILSIRIQEKN